MRNSFLNLKRVSCYFILVIGVIAFSCNEDDEVSKIDQNSQLLAGKNGKSKSWKLISFLGWVSGEDYSHDILHTQFDNCSRENVYTFFNNEHQTYELSTCGQDELIETGNWFFTKDGTVAVIIGNDLKDTGKLGLFYYLPFPGEVKKLTKTSMIIDIVVDSTYRYTLEFKAM